MSRIVVSLNCEDDMKQAVRLGLLTSIGVTLDAFFPPLVQAWNERGIRTFPASGSEAQLVGSEVLPGLTRNPSLRALEGLGSLKRWLRNRQLDVVLANTAMASALARMAITSVPVVYFCHGLHWASPDRPTDVFWRLVERGLLGRTSSVIALNDHDEQWFGQHLDPSQVIRLRLGLAFLSTTFPRRRYPTCPG